mgnify:CR=1 FL=1
MYCSISKLINFLISIKLFLQNIGNKIIATYLVMILLFFYKDHQYEYPSLIQHKSYWLLMV